MQAFCLVLAVFLAFIIPQIDVYVQWCIAFGVGQETLYTTSSNPDFSHMADTTTTISIDSGRTTKIMARVVHSPAVYESRKDYIEVDAYGNVASSAHEAWSDIDHKTIDLMP